MDNLAIYEKVRKVPQEAQKKITGGRLIGKTDINPMWRIKTLTEQFGVCGIGWKVVIENKWLEQGVDGEVAAFVDINLYVKLDGQWSEPIPGTGGSKFVEKETKGLHTSDECYKMAFTDAISVASKMLGIGADVYWDKDKTKYDTEPQEEDNSRLRLAEATEVKLKSGETVTLKELSDEDLSVITKMENNQALACRAMIVLESRQQ